jgi:hypothetical protein
MPYGDQLPDEPVSEGWDITDDGRADWALEQIKAAQDEIARVKALAQAKRDQVNQFEQDACAGPENTIEFFTGLLIRYRRELEVQNPKLPKTYRLPAGNVVRRAGSVSVEVTDLDEFVLWAQDNEPEALEIKPKVSQLRSKPYQASWDSWKKTASELEEVVLAPVVSPYGEAVPGVRLRVNPDRYGVETR